MVLPVSERRACRVVGQHQSTHRRPAPVNPYRDWLVSRMRELAVLNPRRGRWHVMDLLHQEGWTIGTRLMKRLWRVEGLCWCRRTAGNAGGSERASMGSCDGERR